MHFGGIFDYSTKSEQLQEVIRELEQPDIWSNKELAQELAQKRVQLEAVVLKLDQLTKSIQELQELFSLAQMENDDSLLVDIDADLLNIERDVAELEFRRMFAAEIDENNAYLEIQSGSGGTEAQDWAEMLLRMYLRWCEHKGFKTEILELSPGEVAGIKGATLAVRGSFAYGWLRTETGVHRLVRKSPFDSGNRRHTSFAAVFISPEIDDKIEVTINPADLRIDTYRASGAGGQHVNRTDSAVRITHLPTNTVVQCQNDRSQHKNKAQAMKQLSAKLYELERQQANTEKDELEKNKADITWGSQIRSYVLDSARIKDLRTGVETGNTQKVLDGDLDQFIEASLKGGL